MKEIDLVYRTIFAELGQRCLDAAFSSDLPVEGRFVSVPVKGQNYWYFDHAEDGKTRRRYVGPERDPQISERVMSFRALKDDLRARRKLVTTLIREGGLPGPERFTGDVVGALADAGLFRLRGVLVGTVAFQCYGGLLGVRLPATALQTGDADFAQFHAVSAAIEDSLPPVLDLLRALDPSFREIPHLADGRKTTLLENGSRFRVEFLTPNRGSAEHQDRPSAMPALGGVSAQPLRFLDFLIHEPVRSVLLHRSGISVTVPAPERYAVHKLIVASRRKLDANGLTKRSKDVAQAGFLAEALAATRHHVDLAMAYVEAWKRGPSWRAAIGLGSSYLDHRRAAALKETLREGLNELKEDAAVYGLPAGVV